MGIHHLAQMSWPALAALPRDRVIALVPAGAIEAHGPHLPLGTDIIIADAMARAGAQRLHHRGFETLLLPALAMAPAPFAAAFAGTIDVPAETTTAVVLAAARSLGRHGIRWLVIANAHHDPAHVAALRAAVERAAEDPSAAAIVFPDLTRRRWATKLTEEFQSGACHAGRYESSIVLAEAGPLVDEQRMRNLPANPASLVDAIRAAAGTFEEAGGPQAYFGWPADASAAEGREIVAALGRVVEEAVMEQINARAVS